MRFSLYSSLASALFVSLSLAGCSETSTAPSLTPAASAAPPVPTIATTSNTAVLAKPLAGPTAQPTCPSDTKPVDDQPLASGSICNGPLPTYFAQILVRLPQAGSTAQRQEDWVTADQEFSVIPGLGRRPDIMVGHQGPWIRSFEGSDPSTTVYLASGMCDDAYAPACRYGMGLKAYRVTGDGTPMDVTDQLLPDEPTLTPAQRAHYDKLGGGDLWLDTSKLPLASTMRWVMEFDPDQPIPVDDPHDAGGIGHFGFLVWNGQRFELKDRLPRSQWPCFPVPPGERACTGDFPDIDRFVIDGK